MSSYDAYRDIDKLDFMTAAKILFTTPPDKKKFGLDFHLVQLFFVCMPSLAVYLVAQYARYEMRRMEAELELKKQAEEAAKAKEMELKAAEEKEAASDPELLEVKVRLDKLEVTLNEIVVGSKKQSDKSRTKNQEEGNEEKLPANTSAAEDHGKQTSNASKTDSGQGKTNGLSPVSDASQQDQKGFQNEGSSQNTKK